MEWISVKDELPEQGKYIIDYVSYGIHGLLHCAINSHAWKGNKTTHWATITPPTKQQLCKKHKWKLDISWRALRTNATVYRYKCKLCEETKKTNKKLKP